MSDTAAASQEAPARSAPMQRIPFPLESYQHPSKPLSAKYLLNLMVEQAPADARTQAALISTTGTAPWITVGSGPIRAINDDLPGTIYLVSGSHFYRLYNLSSGTPTIQDLGYVATPAGDVAENLFVSIAVGPTAVTVVAPPNAFSTSHNPSDPFGMIGGATVPGPPSSVTQLDGYFVYTQQNNKSQFYISELNNPTSVVALDFASLDAFSNAVTKVVTNGLDLWFAGVNGFEIWYDAGAADFPFRRRPGGIIQHPIATPRSVLVGDGSVWWVGQDSIVCRSDGYHPVRVSTHAIEMIIRALGPSQIQSVVFYSQGGHGLFCINFASRSLVYDATTKAWHDRASSVDGSGRWRVEAIALKQSPPVFGDYQTGALYFPDPTVATDGGVLVKRQAVMPPLWGGTSRAFCSRVELEMEAGSGQTGNVTLDWSDDGGNTWTGGPRVMDPGAAGLYRQRVYTTRLGSFRQRVFRFTVNGHGTFYALDAAISAGSH